jgi:hypothetical protein
MIEVRKITTQEALDSLDQWAASFGHSAQRFDIPLFECWNGDKRLGYFHVPMVPVIFPAVHPDCTPREVLECTQQVVAGVRGRYGSCGAVTTEDSRFTPRIMRHFGFVNPPRKYYE